MSTILTEESEKRKHLKSLSLKSKWVYASDLRLDADYYSLDKTLASKILDDFKTKELKDLLNVPMFWGPRFRRIYTNDVRQGTPFLTAKEVFEFRPESEKLLSKMKISNINTLQVEEDWILLTRSGSVGRLLLTTKILQKFVLTDDLIRIIPDKSKIYPGYLFAYLSTWIAQAMITKDRYGLAIEHLEPFQLEPLRVPILSNDLMLFFDRQIRLVNSLRLKANQKLDEANQEFTQYTGLVDDIPDPLKEKKSFELKFRDLSARFDASFHNPLIKLTINKLKSSRSVKLVKCSKLGRIKVANRFKRIYVERKYGIPFLQGGDVHTIRPYNLKFISQRMTKNLDHWIIRSNSALVTCSGTLGRIGLVSHILNGWAASQHILRITPYDETNGEIGYQVKAGYLAMFLATKFGYNQIIGKTYGGVVDEIYDTDMGDVYIALPNSNEVHDRINTLTDQAYYLKDLATLIEQESILLLENVLQGDIKIRDIPRLKESLMETIEIKSNIDAVQDILESITEINDRNIMPLSELKEKLSL